MTKRRGLTLVELVLTIAAGATVALTAYLLITPYDNVLFTFWRRSGVAEGQAAMTRMLYEIGRIKAPAQISTMTTSHLAFVDIDDAAIDFQTSGTDLVRNGDVLARNMQSLMFEYLDDSGSSVAAAADVRVIRITMQLTAGNQWIYLQSAAGIRNGTSS